MSERTRVDGYLVRDALSAGIHKITGAELYQGYVAGRLGDYGRFFVRDGTAFVRTPAEAEKVAKEMAQRKIKSLEKQLVTLRRLAEKPKWAKLKGEEGADA